MRFYEKENFIGVHDDKNKDLTANLKTFTRPVQEAYEHPTF